MNAGRELDERPPVVILAGSDRRPGDVPAGAEGFRFVAGYKGAEIRIGDRPLIQNLLERLRASGAFEAVYVAGPRAVYTPLVDCQVIDTDSNVGENIRVAVREIRRLHGRASPVAFITCDILPSAAEITDLAEQLLAPGESAPDAGPPGPALCISLVLSQEGLGASSWKPRYRVRPRPGEAPLAYLPGHLALARPAMLRAGLFYRTLQLAYQNRNRDYDRRRRYILLHLIGALLWRDFLNLFRLYPPTLTYSVVRHGLRTFRRWRRGELDLEELAGAIAALTVRRKHFRRLQGKAVRMVVTTHASFAKDIDTREEIDELRHHHSERSDT